MNVVRSSRGGERTQSAALVLACTVALSASPAVAQVARLQPVGEFVEVVDPSERISGNAAAGIVLVGEGDTIGSDRLWAYLSDSSGPVASKLKLQINSIDGRYFAEIEYATDEQSGWVALHLPLSKFAFLDDYSDPISEVAALLGEAGGSRFYPVRWGTSHGAASATPPDDPKDTDPLRLYVNTERAQAFVVVDDAPAYCRDASAMSGFKFNVVCDMKLGDIRLPDAGNGHSIIEGIEVFRRSGVRTLAPLALDVRMSY